MKKSILWMAVLAALWASPGNAQEGSGPPGSRGDGRGYFDFGVFAYEDGAYAEAVDHFQMALEFEPNNPAYLHYLGRTLLAQKQLDAAAVPINRALEINPQLPGLKYDAARLYMERGDHSQAADLFEKAAAESPEDVLARYYAGVSLFRIGRYGEAATYFLSAAEKSPEARVRGRYYAGVAYQKDGQSGKALALCEAVMGDPQAGQFAQLAEEWAAAIREGDEEEDKPWNLFAKFGRRYDDNVVLDPDDVDLFSEESDWGTHFFFSGQYEFLRREPFYMGASYRHYWMDYDDLDKYDLTGSLGDLYAAYRFAPFTARLVYSPRYYWADGESYLRRYSSGPDLLWQPSRRLLARLAYRFSDNRYFEDENRTGEDHTLFSEAYFRILEGKGRLFGRLEYETRSAEADDEEYGQWRFRAGGTLELPWKLEAGLSGEYRARNYDTADRFYRVEREDDRYSTSLHLSRPFLFEWLGLLAEYRHIQNDSNINDYEYSRNQFTFSVTATY